MGGTQCSVCAQGKHIAWMFLKLIWLDATERHGGKNVRRYPRQRGSRAAGHSGGWASGQPGSEARQATRSRENSKLGLTIKLLPMYVLKHFYNFSEI